MSEHTHPHSGGRLRFGLQEVITLGVVVVSAAVSTSVSTAVLSTKLEYQGKATDAKLDFQQQTLGEVKGEAKAARESSAAIDKRLSVIEDRLDRDEGRRP